MIRRLAGLLAAAITLGAADDPFAGDVLMRAMLDELERSRTLRIASLDAPYYIEYAIADLHIASASATMGALLNQSRARQRAPRVQVRVGDYALDNTNYALSDLFTGTRLDPEQMVLENDYAAIRRHLWLATDRSYKTAAEAIGRKRSALAAVTQPETLPDFWKADPVVLARPATGRAYNHEAWVKRTVDLSAVFESYPTVTASAVTFRWIDNTHRMVNTEGTRIRVPESLAILEIRGEALAADGAWVRDADIIESRDLEKLGPENGLRDAARAVAENIRALAAAPVGETYSGPVLFEGLAAPQLVAALLGPELGVRRRPVGEPGRPVPFRASELESRIGSRILPEFLSLTDNPELREWKGELLLGHYSVDDEGVAAQPVKLIEGGRLSTLLLTRQPVKGFAQSNGHGRIPGAMGGSVPLFSNLLLEATEAVPGADLRDRLLALCAQRNKPYGLVVRKLDYPSTASMGELRRMSASGAGSSVLTAPLLVYRVYPDGREELIRGVRFRGVTHRSLRDIVAVSDRSTAFHFLNNAAPFAFAGLGGYVAPSSVIAPALLLDEVEMERIEDEQLRPPVVPAPPSGR